MAQNPLRIVIYARLGFQGQAGGIEQFLIALINALGKLDDGPEQYLIITDDPAPETLASYLGPNQKLIPAKKPSAPPPPSLWKRITNRLRPTPTSSSPSHREQSAQEPTANRIFPDDDGHIAALNPHLVHFPYQWMLRCNVPMIFNPHDLQHRHFPEFFEPDQLKWREDFYAQACDTANMIIAESQAGRDDLIEQYHLPQERVQTILRGSPTEAYNPLNPQAVIDARKELDLPETFAYFPAQTWPHKNHLQLLEALVILRDRHDISLPLICTGRLNDHYNTIQAKSAELGLTQQARFLGFVTTTQLRAIYAASTFVVFPSLFEGGGFPIQEAFLENTPVTCSNVTSLPGYAGDAALLFDPKDPTDIANALKRMATEPSLRDQLRKLGTQRIKQFSWEQTAKTYRALYRTLAGRTLTDEDKSALESEGLAPTN